MKTYPKINTIFERDLTKSKKKPPIILGTWSEPEFEYLKDSQWDGYEKLDGQNIRIQFYPNRGERFVKGKEDAAKFFEGVEELLKAIFTVELLSKVFPTKEKEYEVCLYGEVYGAGVPALDKPGKIPYSDYINFSLIDVKIGNWWLSKESVSNIANDLNLNATQIAFKGTLIQAIEFVKKGFKSLVNNDVDAEGLVLFPALQLYNRKGERIVTKLKTKDFIRLNNLVES
jgi:hypothetical protein